MVLKIGDRVKVPDTGRVLDKWDVSNHSAYVYWENNNMIIHGSKIPLQEYFDKGGKIIDIRGDYALVNAPCEIGVQIPWKLKDLIKIKVSLKELLEEL